MGAGVALRTAIQHPHLVRKLVVVSFPFQSAGFFPDIAAQQKQLGPHLAVSMQQSPMYQLYSGLAPRVEDWPRLVGRLGELMGREFDWTDELGGIQARVMLLVGDADMLPPAHAAQFFALLGGGHSDGHWNRSGMTKHRLAILPGTTHYDILQSPLLLPSIAPFLAEG
ncbi:alpha/beta hydrolase [Deinococcus cavernae]|uniref:Alpha/beta hydrolase n=2 Tax=Deinococcus cavernae TaxID=2320857 RepID=A0A418V8U8_9DEIO|nr:alpha/beta hydrolase [Deinococcus cavernae]